MSKRLRMGGSSIVDRRCLLGVLESVRACKSDPGVPFHETEVVKGAAKEWSSTGLVKSGPVLVSPLTAPSAGIKAEDLGPAPRLSESPHKKLCSFHQF